MHRTDKLIQDILSTTCLPPTVGSVRDYLLVRHPAATQDQLWLIGTEGCHLCKNVYRDYQMLAKRQSMPELCVLDVMEFDDKILSIIAPQIPILVGFQQLLVYPFGILDINAIT